MTHSINHDIDKELKTLILNVANNNPAPMLGKVNTVSDDGKYISVNLSRGGTLPAVKVFSGTAKPGAEVILIFLEGNLETPRAFIEDYVESTLYYNLLCNGNFAIMEKDVFKNWTGGSKTNTSFYGSNGCELKQNKSLISDFIDISSIDEEAFTVSFVWKGGSFTLEVLDANNNPISAVPSVFGNKQQMDFVSDWSYQRYNYLVSNHKQVKLRFTNNDKTSTFIDGIRIWKPDDYQEWLPHKNDVF